MKRFLLSSAIILAPSIALANAGVAEKCHRMSNDQVRLMCYDKQTGYGGQKADPEKKEDVVAAAPAAAPEQNGSQWRYSEERSALDNRKDVWLSVESKNTEGNAIGSPIRATLWLRCMENKTNVLIGFDRYTTDNQNVRFRLDEDPVQKQWMETMRGGEGIGIWSGSRAIPFIKKLFGKDSMVLAYDTYTGPVEFTFDISGVREQIAPLAEACSWTP